MFCSKCGNKLEDDAVFCSQCGSRIMRNNSPAISSSSNQRQTGGRDFKNIDNKKHLYGLIVSLILVVIFGVLSFKAVTPNMVKCTIISVSNGRVMCVQFEDGSESEYTTQDLHVKYKNHEGHVQITSRDFQYYEGDSIKLCLTKGELTQLETKSIDGFMEIATIILFVLSIISCGWFGFKYSGNKLSVIISIVVAVIAILAIILVFTSKGGSSINEDEVTEEQATSEPASTLEYTTQEPATEEYATSEPPLNEDGEPAIANNAVIETYEAATTEATLADWKQVYLKAMDDETILSDGYCSYDLRDFNNDDIPELVCYDDASSLIIYTISNNEIKELDIIPYNAGASGDIIYCVDNFGNQFIYQVTSDNIDTLFSIEPDADGSYFYNGNQYSYEEIYELACNEVGVDSNSFEWLQQPYDIDTILTAIAEY